MSGGFAAVWCIPPDTAAVRCTASERTMPSVLSIFHLVICESPSGDDCRSKTACRSSSLVPVSSSPPVGCRADLTIVLSTVNYSPDDTAANMVL